MTLLAIPLILVGCFILVRSALLTFSAEFGRRHDLIKHTYRGGTDFHIAVVIPYTDTTQSGALQELVKALERQDYPPQRIGIHIIATEESVFGLPHNEELPSNVKIWTYPAKQGRHGQLISWLTERLLAAGGPTKLFAFLEPDDIVRQDFLKNITTRAYDCFAMQGYTALKRVPQGITGYAVSLATRMMNRVENAGRFHLGLSARLMTSGWVVRQELLEMIPFRQGQDIDNLEYTLLLNMSGYRVHWAPNVLVYRNEKIELIKILKDSAHAFLNRIQLAVRYCIPLILLGVREFDPGLLDQAWCVIKPPTFLIGTIGIVCALASLIAPSILGNFNAWLGFSLVFVGLQLAAAAVARFSLKDMLFYVMVEPFIYIAGLTLFPLFLLLATAENTLRSIIRPRHARVGLRFDESQPTKRPVAAAKSQLMSALAHLDGPAPETVRKKDLLLSSSLKDKLKDPSQLFIGKRSVSKLFEDPGSLSDPDLLNENNWKSELFNGTRSEDCREDYQMPISNGKQSVMCSLTAIKNEGVYHLIFSYKQLSFKTKAYRILDQAYYELETRLEQKGFKLLSCGSCAYFYRPTAGNAHGIATEAGFCLYGKLGKDLSVDMGVINVMSDICAQHTDMIKRPEIVQTWQDSLLYEPSSL